MTPDSTLAVTKTCPKDGVHLYRRSGTAPYCALTAIQRRIGLRLLNHPALVALPDNPCSRFCSLNGHVTVRPGEPHLYLAVGDPIATGIRAWLCQRNHGVSPYLSKQVHEFPRKESNHVDALPLGYHYSFYRFR